VWEGMRAYVQKCTDPFIPTIISKERAGQRGSRLRWSHRRAVVRLEVRWHARIIDRTWE
jgi:hypothetical protein